MSCSEYALKVLMETASKALVGYDLISGSLFSWTHHFVNVVNCPFSWVCSYRIEGWMLFPIPCITYSYFPQQWSMLFSVCCERQFFSAIFLEISLFGFLPVDIFGSPQNESLTIAIWVLNIIHYNTFLLCDLYPR